MRVLYLTGMFCTKYGALEKFNVELLKQGVSLTVVYNGEPAPQAYVNDINSLGGRIYVIKGNIISRAIQAYKIVRKVKPDIVHYHFGFLVYFLLFPLRLLDPKIKQILTQHCEYIYTNKLMIALSKICYKRLDLVISVSNGVQNRLKRLLGDSDKFIVSYLGCEKRDYKSKRDIFKELNISDSLIISSIGFDIDVKGFDILAEAVKHLISTHSDLPKFKILIIGLNESEDAKFKVITKVLNVDDYFISAGIVNDIDNYLKYTNIYIQPSRTEALSLSIAESLMYGIPIIGSNVGGIPEVCINGYNGILFKNKDHIELASALHSLLTNADLRQEYGQNSLSLSSNFDLTKNANKLINLYNTITNR